MESTFISERETVHPTDFDGRTLCLQWGAYRDSFGNAQRAYRFIWRRVSDGSIQNRSSTGFPSLMDAKILMTMAAREGWGWHNGQFPEPTIPPIDTSLLPLEQFEREMHSIGVDSETRVDAFLRWSDRGNIGVDYWWQAFNIAWGSCDDTWHARDALLERLELAEEWQCGWDALEGQDLAFYNALPKTITVYRGCSMDRVMGLAWTTDRKIAVEFARGHRDLEVANPVLASAKIKKNRVFTTLADRNESEIVLDPRRLTNLRVEFVDPVYELEQFDKGGEAA